MKSRLIPIFALLGVAANLNAASYSTNFNSYSGPEIAGTDGWGINDATVGLSFLVNWNGSKAAALGGLVDSPSASTVGLNHAYTDTFGNTSVAFNFTIVDSSDTYPDRDTFAVSLYNGSGNLFKILFTPNSQTGTPDSDPNAQWNLSYVAGAGPTVSLTQGVLEGGTYSLSLLLSPNGSSTNFNLTVSGGTTANRTGTIAVNPSSATTNFGVLWTPTSGPSNAGSNYFLFDNLAVVPEVSSSLLFCFTGLGLVARRKRR
jgi:hypothetical protein